MPPPLRQALLLTAVLLHAGLSNARSLQAASNNKTLYDLLNSTPELKHILQLFNYTNLLPLTQDPATKITCFFPSSKYANATSLIDWDKYYDFTYHRFVWATLLHNCLDGETALTQSKLKASQTYPNAIVWRPRAYPTLVTSDVFIIKKPDGTYVSGEGYSEGKIIRADLKGGKSIVHMTDGKQFLIPMFAPPDSFFTISDFLAAFDMTIASAVFSASSLAAELANPTKPLTIFAPTDGAFNGLLAQLGITLDRLLANATMVDKIAKMHVLRGRYLYQGALLSYKQGVKLQMVFGPVNVTTDLAIFPGRSGPAKFLTVSSPFSSARIGSYDIGGNGNDIGDPPPSAQWVAHFLDNVLLPYNLASIKKAYQ